MKTTNTTFLSIDFARRRSIVLYTLLRLTATLALFCCAFSPRPSFGQSFSGSPLNYSDGDIGSPRITGSARLAGTALTVAGSGADIWGSHDSFNYASVPANGNNETLVAEVTSVTNTDPWAKSGVMIRDSNSPSAIFVDVVVTPGNGVAMEARDAVGHNFDVHVAGVVAPTSASPVWVKLVKTGSSYEGFYSPNGLDWTQVGSGFSIFLSKSTYLAGLAVTSHNIGALNTSTFANVSLSGSAAVSNVASSTQNLTNYLQLAAEYSSEAGIAYRYGSPSTLSNSGLPTWYQPADKAFDQHPYPSFLYQVGGSQVPSENDYNDNFGQVLYVPDQAHDTGVDDVETLLMSQGVFSEKPQLPWQYYGAGHPDPESQQPKYIAANGGALHQPTAVGRSYGLYMWGVNDIVAFQSGLLATFGTYTSPGTVCLKLPAGKMPTAVAITDNNEFALVTVWDTNTMKGQVAVLALGTGNDFWRDWTAVYPGIRNNGLFTFIKLLGFVDLPGMSQPTEISASTDYAASFDNIQGWFNSPDGSSYRYFADQLTLSNETNRQSFVSGPNSIRYSKAGYAVITSKAEKKVIFLDLKPLFAEVQNMYFTTHSNFVLTQNVGQAPSQWPYTFGYAPHSAPTVVATIKMDQPPTAVRTSLIPGVNQAYVATQDGNLHIFNVGAYGTASGGSPSDIAEVGTVAVGSNPTSIAYVKSFWYTPTDPGNQYMVVSRGERAIKWLNIKGNTGKIVKTLQDKRLQDPIWAEDNDNHGTQSPIVTVTDYSGRQVSNYRYGPITFYTNGGASFGVGPTGTDEFEFGGAYPVAGYPFQVSSSNTP